MVGASLALALAAAGRRIVLIEGVSPDSSAHQSFDERTTALGNASRRILEALGCVERRRRSVRGDPRHSCLRCRPVRLRASDAREQGIEAFGFVVPNRVLGAALWEQIRAQRPPSACACRRRLSPSAPTRRASRVRLAGQGTASCAPDWRSPPMARIRRYVGMPALPRPKRTMTRLRSWPMSPPTCRTMAPPTSASRAAGPLALVPLRDGSYTRDVGAPSRRRPPQRSAASDDGLSAASCSSTSAGAPESSSRVGRRASYPLKLTRADAAVAQRTVLIGNAAQSLHPVAGQGFNLALRDVAALAELVAGGRRSGHRPRCLRALRAGVAPRIAAASRASRMD